MCKQLAQGALHSTAWWPWEVAFNEKNTKYTERNKDDTDRCNRGISRITTDIWPGNGSGRTYVLRYLGLCPPKGTYVGYRNNSVDPLQNFGVQARVSKNISVLILKSGPECLPVWYRRQFRLHGIGLKGIITLTGPLHISKDLNLCSSLGIDALQERVANFSVPVLYSIHAFAS